MSRAVLIGNLADSGIFPDPLSPGKDVQVGLMH